MTDFSSHKTFINFKVFLITLSLIAGNAALQKIDIGILILMPLILICLIEKSLPIVNAKWLLLDIFLLIMILILILEINITYNPNYFLWCLKAIILTVILYSTKYKESNELIILFISIFTIFILASLILGTSKDGRLNFVYGPNMLYRISCILFMISTLQYKQKKLSKPIYASIYLLVTFSLLEINSRGGILLFTVLNVVFFYKNKVLWAIFPVLILSIYLYASALPEKRIISGFALNILAESDRGIFLKHFIQNFNPTQIHTYEEFSNFSKFGFAYPHNIIVELVYFFGPIGFCLSIIIGIGVINIKKHIYSYSILSSVFVCFLFGSLFSGDLSDNFAVIVIAFASMGGVLKSKRSQNKIQNQRYVQ